MPLMTDKKNLGRPRSADRHKPAKKVRVKQTVYDLLEQIAKANERPIQWEVERGLKAHVLAECKRLGITPPAGLAD